MHPEEREQCAAHLLLRRGHIVFDEVNISQALRDSKVMLTHYSAEVLFSPTARASYVEPDLEAIPQ